MHCAPFTKDLQIQNTLLESAYSLRRLSKHPPCIPTQFQSASYTPFHNYDTTSSKISSQSAMLHPLSLLKRCPPQVGYYPCLSSSSASKRALGRLFSSSASTTTTTAATATATAYEEEMLKIWRQDPARVDPGWDAFFRNREKKNFFPSSPFSMTTTTTRSSGESPETAALLQQFLEKLQQSSTEGASDATMSDTKNIAMIHLIRSYQSMGHLVADLDPLKLNPKPYVAELDPATYGFTEADMDREFTPASFPGITGFMGQGGKLTLRAMLEQLRSAYCGTIGVEYHFIQSREQRNFIRDRFEVADAVKKGLSKEERLQVLDRLYFAELFEQFLAKRFSTSRRFGLDGCEAVIPGVKLFVDRASELGAKNFVIGMPHRGRLNVLVNVMRKPAEVVMSEFLGTNIDDQKFYDEMIHGYSQSGDVKYHLGTSFSRAYPDGRKVNLALLANPSHLEAVNPVVLGKAKAKQHYSQDHLGLETVPIIMHGDAAFCGQGIVYESMHFAKLRGYGTGGTLNIIVNNQIGFTADVQDGRSTRYASDLGKAFEAPIFHVNADDPEACAYVFKAAAEWRQTYRSDVIIDVIGYRRYGHNETDSPDFTQPTMYSKIRKHPTVLKIHSERVIKEGLCDQKAIDDLKSHVGKVFDDAYAKSKTPGAVQYKEDWLDSRWKGFKSIRQLSRIRPTGVDLNVLKDLGEKLYNTTPEGFHMHKNLLKQTEEKRKMISTGQNLDWSCAEHLAYATLVLEGNHVRLSGQDVERGTFSHRHATLHDQLTNQLYRPLGNITPAPLKEGEDQGTIRLNPNAAVFQAFNSHLSEYGVLGFELGYSLENPNSLVIWEAQFGDFSNGAQIIIDQFISCGEAKWLRQSGLVMLLPHGYDGQGPEHSSSRVERFLQLSDENPDEVPDMDPARTMQIQHSNWQVVNCTTPAQIFHVLRRQVHREFRKPLIVCSPKMLLKLRECSSNLEDFGPGKKFERLLPEVDPEVNAQDPSSIRKLIFCVGKIYYHLAKSRKEKKAKDIAIVRIEQISPFPFDMVAEQVKKYPKAELVFVQEEPKNMGTWYYVDDRIYTATRVLCPERNNGDGLRCKYVGRKTMASPAVGYGNVHNREQESIIERGLA